MSTGLKDRRRRPGRLSGDRAATRGHVDEFVARQVDRDWARVRDLGELVRRGCPARHHLGHEHRGCRPRDERGKLVGSCCNRRRAGARAESTGRKGDDEKQDELTGVPDAIHRRPPEDGRADGGRGRGESGTFVAGGAASPLPERSTRDAFGLNRASTRPSSQLHRGSTAIRGEASLGWSGIGLRCADYLPAAWRHRGPRQED